jgi:hypothetical protein
MGEVERDHAQSRQEPTIRAVPLDAPEIPGVAFTAELTGLQPGASTGQSAKDQISSELPAPMDRKSINPGPASSAAQEPVRAAAVHARKQESEFAPHQQRESGTLQTVLHPPIAAQERNPGPSSGRTVEQAGEPAARSAAEPQPEPQKPSGAARDIRLEMTGGDQRVEVKLTERGGEVRVAVRTPDEHLADRLRDNLPSLSSRLAENGIRTETWHPAAADGGRHVNEAPRSQSAEGSGSQSRHNQGGQQERESRPRTPQKSEESDSSKEKERDFAWLMSTTGPRT